MSLVRAVVLSFAFFCKANRILLLCLSELAIFPSFCGRTPFDDHPGGMFVRLLVFVLCRVGVFLPSFFLVCKVWLGGNPGNTRTGYIYADRIKDAVMEDTVEPILR